MAPTSCEIWIITRYLLKKIQFLSIAFDGDVLFKLLLFFKNVHNHSQMQGMDKKYDGHACYKVIITNIKNSFGLNLRKVHCLGHLRCVQDDCEDFVNFGSYNEIF